MANTLVHLVQGRVHAGHVVCECELQAYVPRVEGKATTATTSSACDIEGMRQADGPRAIQVVRGLCAVVASGSDGAIRVAWVEGKIPPAFGVRPRPRVG